MPEFSFIVVMHSMHNSIQIHNLTWTDSHVGDFNAASAHLDLLPRHS